MDLNADLGEHDGEAYARDFALLDIVTSASIACGAHAGSADVMMKTVVAAGARGVAVGAHPGYPDRDGFGRRSFDISGPALAHEVSSQIAALVACCVRAAVPLRYVKPHGALYNLASRDRSIAKTIAGAVAALPNKVVLLALAGSCLESEAIAAGLPVAREAFIDRGYMDDGTLAPRDVAGGIIDDPNVVAERALAIARDHMVVSVYGVTVSVNADSLCVHSDTRNATEMAATVKTRLGREGIAWEPFTR